MRVNFIQIFVGDSRAPVLIGWSFLKYYCVSFNKELTGFRIVFAKVCGYTWL
jgi:hypothetical protein